MAGQEVMRAQAKSGAVRIIDDDTAEIWFLTEGNASLRIHLPQSALVVLAHRINDLIGAPSGYKTH